MSTAFAGIVTVTFVGVTGSYPIATAWSSVRLGAATLGSKVFKKKKLREEAQRQRQLELDIAAWRAKWIREIEAEAAWLASLPPVFDICIAILEGREPAKPTKSTFVPCRRCGMRATRTGPSLCDDCYEYVRWTTARHTASAGMLNEAGIMVWCQHCKDWFRSNSPDLCPECKEYLLQLNWEERARVFHKL